MTYRQRASEFIYNSLYMKKSSFIGFKAKDLGYGLFSNIDIDEGTTIGRYKGEFISNNEKELRIRQGKDGYFVYFNENEVLDCYEQRNLKECKLNFCNSHDRAFHKYESYNASKHCRLVVNTRQRYVSLKAVKKIKAHEEIYY